MPHCQEAAAGAKRAELPAGTLWPAGQGMKVRPVQYALLPNPLDDVQNAQS